MVKKRREIIVSEGIPEESLNLLEGGLICMCIPLTGISIE